jgi:hypothetical protein
MIALVATPFDKTLVLRTLSDGPLFLLLVMSLTMRVDLGRRLLAGGLPVHPLFG